MSSWQRKLEAVETIARAGKHSRALFLLDETLKEHTDIPIYTVKFDILVSLNRTKEAVDVARQMVVTNQRLPEAYLKAGQLCASLKRYSVAIGIVNTGIAAYHELDQEQLSPEDIRKWVKLYLRKKELQSSEQQRLSCIRDPMTILPSELISDIVKLAIDDLNVVKLIHENAADGHDLLIRLSRVSRLWRQTMLSLTGLWRGCFLRLDGSKTDPYRKLEAYRERSDHEALQEISIFLEINQEYSFLKDLQRLYDQSTSWLDPKANMRSIIIATRVTYLESAPKVPFSSLIDSSKFETVDSFEYKCFFVEQGLEPLRNFDSNFLMKKVRKSIKLCGVSFQKDDQIQLQYSYARTTDPIETIAPPYDHPLHHLSLLGCSSPTVVYLMTLFPNLRTIEMRSCLGGIMEIDAEITQVHHSNIETLILERYDRIHKDGVKPQRISYRFPNLRHCGLRQNDWDIFGCLHLSKKLRHLELRDFEVEREVEGSDKAHLRMLRDRFIAAFDEFEELEVMALEKVDFTQQILETVLKNRLCSKLRKLTAKYVRNGPAVDDIVVEIIKQRNFTDHFASIEDFSMMSCNSFKYQSIDFIRQHVDTSKFDPFYLESIS